MPQPEAIKPQSLAPSLEGARIVSGGDWIAGANNCFASAFFSNDSAIYVSTYRGGKLDLTLTSPSFSDDVKTPGHRIIFAQRGKEIWTTAVEYYEFQPGDETSNMDDYHINTHALNWSDLRNAVELSDTWIVVDSENNAKVAFIFKNSTSLLPILVPCH